MITKPPTTLLGLCRNTDLEILEPCAGTGQIASKLDFVINKANQDLTCYEINSYRFEKLESQITPTRYGGLLCCDFLQVPEDEKYDLVITNPPFDFALEFIEKGLEVLSDFPESRLIYLMPIDTFSAKKRANQFKELDAHIAQIHLIPGRIDYLRNGVPMSKCQQIKNGIPQFKGYRPLMCSGRQVSDAIFTIKKGKGNDAVSFLEV